MLLLRQAVICFSVLQVFYVESMQTAVILRKEAGEVVRDGIFLEFHDCQDKATSSETIDALKTENQAMKQTILSMNYTIELLKNKENFHEAKENKTSITQEQYDYLIRKIDSSDVNPTVIIIKTVFQNAGTTSFVFSADRKLITRKVTGNDWKGVLAEHKFPPSGVSKFSVILRNVVSNKQIMIGVALSETDLSSGAYYRSTAWMLYLNNVYLHTSAASYSYFPTPRLNAINGDVISVIVDMDKRMLFYELNGVSLGLAANLMTMSEAQKYDLRPAVDLYGDASYSLEFI